MKSKHSLDDSYDVIISGAGVVGMTLAGLLIGQGMKVVLIESKPQADLNINTIDPRTLAITPGSQKILQQAGIWQTLAIERIGQFEKIQVWDEAGIGKIEFDVNDSLEATLGFIIENQTLQAAANEAISKLQAITVYQPAAITAIENTEKTVVVSLDNGRRLQSNLLVAADGARSSIRDLSSIAYISDAYDQTAVAGVIKTQLDHNKIARQRFLHSGILALLPLSDHSQCGFVWSTSHEHADQLKHITENQFCQKLTQASESVLGEVTQCYVRQTFPLQSAQAEHYCQQRLVLIGDAAHSVHPLAGQGANLGLMDAAVLAEEIHRDKQHNRDFGELYNLRRYERRRRSENIMMMNTFSGFKSLFESQSLLVRQLRNTGMQILENVTPLKRLIMHRAMGISGDIPQELKTPDFL